jgi:DNA-binding GntR family transcriptional regulator
MPRDAEQTIAARIARDLADRIVSGQLAPGIKLRQDHIAAEFGASHVPVREAFGLLVAQGLAVSEPRKGVRVASFSLADVKEVAEMRAALEVLALRHAGSRLTPALLDQAEQAADEADRSQDIHTWEAANRRFHRIILAPCEMPRLLASIDDLHSVSARFLFAAFGGHWQPRVDSEHRVLLGALRAGDAETAAAVLSRHVRRIGQGTGLAAPGLPSQTFTILG